MFFQRVITGSLKPTKKKNYSYSNYVIIQNEIERLREEEYKRKQQLAEKYSIELRYFIDYIYIKFKKYPDLIEELNKIIDTWKNPKPPVCAATQVQMYIEKNYFANDEIISISKELYAENGKRFHQWMELCLRYGDVKSKKCNEIE